MKNVIFFSEEDVARMIEASKSIPDAELAMAITQAIVVMSERWKMSDLDQVYMRVIGMSGTKVPHDCGKCPRCLARAGFKKEGSS